MTTFPLFVETNTTTNYQFHSDWIETKLPSICTSVAFVPLMLKLMLLLFLFFLFLWLLLLLLLLLLWWSHSKSWNRHFVSKLENMESTKNRLETRTSSTSAPEDGWGVVLDGMFWPSLGSILAITFRETKENISACSVELSHWNKVCFKTIHYILFRHMGRV